MLFNKEVYALYVRFKKNWERCFFKYGVDFFNNSMYVH